MNEATRTALAERLRKRGCRVVTAGTAAAVLAVADKSPFDLVISDPGLPNDDGADLMQTLRARFSVQGIATRGFGTEADGPARERGSRDSPRYLTQPLAISRLEHAIRQGRWANGSNGKM